MTSLSSTPDLLAFISLSLLPSWRWLAVAERLRAGDPAADVFVRLAEEHWHGEPDAVDAIRARATAALARARTAALTPVTWSDPAYPVALAAIADPPPLIWVRGQIEALNRSAVAIVGSRAASAYAMTVAVLGSGLDVIYPPEHRTLVEDIERRGAVVSEQIPGTPPLRWCVP